MAEASVNVSSMTLRALARRVKDAVEALEPDLWVTAELAQVNLNTKSGHCYLDLVEKEGDSVVAQMKANIWAAIYKKVAQNFARATGSPLSKGMKVLLLVRVTYHEVFGLSLSVRDIDPRFTLGEMALKRKETLERLGREGLLDRNRRLPEPLVPRRLAVIASESSAGYGDFVERLTNNPYGYVFSLKLFKAYMQGDKAEASVIEALGQVMAEAERFDLVVIIRGGGSQVDLHCFDGYGLAAAVALSVLPVFTGIGHERDETVVDRVAMRRLITPSAVAEYIVSRLRDFEDRVETAMRRMVVSVNRTMASEGKRLALLGSTLSAASLGLTAARGHELSRLAVRFRHASGSALQSARTRLQYMAQGLSHRVQARMKSAGHTLGTSEARLRSASGYIIKSAPARLGELGARLTRSLPGALEKQSSKLRLLEAKTALLDPAKVLQRGYSITYDEAGAALKDASALRQGQSLRTVLYKGSLTSTVDKISREED